MINRQRPSGRPAVTLIELMVVITIIAILVALLTGAVMKAISKGPELVTSSEMGEFQSKLSAEERDAGVKYLPSRLHLSKQNFYPNKGVPNSLDADSVRFLTERFGKNACFNFTALSGANFIDWNGDGVANEELYLEGEQCLVFHLGGIPSGVTPGSITMLGFSLNQQNPAAAPTVGAHRGGPFFDFQSNRLKAITSAFTDPVAFPLPPNGHYGPFPVYLDPWVQVGGGREPYAYFVSSNKEGAGQYSKYGSSDCPSILAATTGNPLVPYLSPSGVAFNPSSCQIISAGKDGKFGPGGILPKAGTSDQYGKDDQANFGSRVLGNQQ